jgi:hypothetical protein
VYDLVFKEAVKVNIYKLSGLQSQTIVHEVLADFVASDTAEVCVLLANMQETTPKTINHVRVMIEEAEIHIPSQRCKIFVLLLHFSPAQFFHHCYPVLFLRGWDHCYLDTIAHSVKVDSVDDIYKGVDVGSAVDIYNWLSKCCFPVDSDSAELDKPQTCEALGQVLDQTVPMLSARVYFGNKKDKSINSVMNAAERSKALGIVLLRERGLGDIICRRFLTYWKPSVMVKFLKRAATISKERESTLNITDSIQTHFNALFTDFCIYMLTRANEDHNLDIIYNESRSAPLEALFVKMFEIFPIPKLEQLSLLSSSLIRMQPSVHIPHFPFFNFVCDEIEKQVDLSNKTVNVQSDFLEESSEEREVLENRSAMLQKLVQAVVIDLDAQLQVIYITIPDERRTTYVFMNNS